MAALQLRATALLQVKLLTSRELEEEVVGAKGAAGERVFTIRSGVHLVVGASLHQQGC